MNCKKAMLSLAVFLLSCLPYSLAQGTYTQIDYPGAVWTRCWGINTAGQISGTYWDVNLNSHGFLLSDGNYTTINYPGAAETFLTGMNDEGQIVGYTDNTGVDAGFLYSLRTKAFTDVTYPGSYVTLPFAINNAGAIAGDFYLYGVPSQGFVLAGSTYSEGSWPGSAETQALGISSSGAVVGIAYGKNYDYFGFTLVNGKYLRITIPNTAEADVYGINPKGSAVVGAFGTEGFLYQDEVLQTLNFPSQNATVATGVNSAGEVVGYFSDSDSNTHGFTWTPSADEKHPDLRP